MEGKNYMDKFSNTLKRFVKELDEKNSCEGTIEFLEIFDELDMNIFIDRIYKNTKDIKAKIENYDESIFTEEFNLLPNIDLNDIYYKLNDKRKKRVFVYINLLAILAQNIKNEKETEEFNPFRGVGEKNQTYGVEQFISSLKAEIPDDTKSNNGGNANIGSMARMMGLDKMLNSDQLKEQLTNITPEKMKEIKKDARNILGNMNDGEQDEEFMKTFDNMLDIFFSKVSETDFNNNENDPLNTMIGLASNVSDEIGNNIDKSQLSNLMGTVMKFASKAQQNNSDGDDPMKAIMDMMSKGNFPQE